MTPIGYGGYVTVTVALRMALLEAEDLLKAIDDGRLDDVLRPETRIAVIRALQKVAAA